MVRLIAFIPLPLLVVGVFLFADFARLYFEKVQRPMLVSAHFLPKGVFEPQQMERAPPWFVLARSTQNGDAILEEYVGREGSMAEVRYKNGRWMSTLIECNVGKYQSVVAAAGFLLFATGVILVAFRTREWPSITRLRTFNRREAILVIYGAAIFVSTLVAPGGSCIV